MRTRLAVLAILMLLVAFGWRVGDAPDRVGLLAWNTAQLVAGTAAFALPLGVALAALFFRTDIAGAVAARLLLTIALFIPLPVYAGAWKGMFGTPTPIPGAFPAETWRMLSAIAVHAIAALPWVVFIVGLGLRSVEPELEQEALLAAHPLRVFLRVTLPRAAGSIAAATAVLAVTVAGEIAVTDLFQVRTYAEEVYSYFALYGPSGAPVLLGVPGMLVLAVGFAAASVYLLSLSPQRWDLLWAPRHVFELGPWRRWATAAGFAALLLPLVAVMGCLTRQAGMVSRPVVAGDLPDRFLSGANFQQHWSGAAALQAIVAGARANRMVFRDTLVIGGLTAGLCLLISLPLAWWLRQHPRANTCIGLALGAALAVPGPVLGLALIATFSRPGVLGAIYDSIAFVSLGQALRLWPLVFLAVWGPIRMIPASILEMAVVDGASVWQRIWLIHRPLSLPAARVGFLTGLALSIGELAIAVLLEPPGVTTLSVRIFQFLHLGMDSHLAGITIVLSLTALLAGILAHASARAIKPVSGDPVR